MMGATFAAIGRLEGRSPHLQGPGRQGIRA
jgi:hypothetical protein